MEMPSACALLGSGICRGEILDLVNCNPKLVLPVQECSSCARACVVLDLVGELSKVAGDLLDARDRVLRRHSGQPNPTASLCAGYS